MTSTRHDTRETPPLDDRTLADGCREVAGWLDAASKADPMPLQQELARAERAVARLRDGLIARLRAAPPTEDTARPRAALAQINVALSLIVGGEYPVGRIERRFVGDASGVLRGVAGMIGTA
jgi:hypothetical protein